MTCVVEWQFSVKTNLERFKFQRFKFQSFKFQIFKDWNFKVSKLSCCSIGSVQNGQSQIGSQEGNTESRIIFRKQGKTEITIYTFCWNFLVLNTYLIDCTRGEYKYSHINFLPRPFPLGNAGALNHSISSPSSPSSPSYLCQNRTKFP